MMGKDQMNWRRACPSWAKANPFYFLQAHDEETRIRFISCFPKMGKVESVLLLTCPVWAEANPFHFLSAQTGQSRIFFASAQTGQSCGKRKSFLDFYSLMWRGGRYFI